MFRSFVVNIERYEELEEENKKLRKALLIHKHTDKCFEYAGNTAAKHGNYYCIAECADSHKKALEE